MQSIIGCLQFAIYVIVPGKAFIWRLIDRTVGVSVSFYHVTLNEEAKNDLDVDKNSAVSQWWNNFYITDADFWWYSAIHWCFSQAMVCDEISIAKAIKTFPASELYPTVLVLHVFWYKTCNKHVIFHCDNEAICDIINKQTSKDIEMMGLVHSLVIVFIQYNIQFHSLH